MSAKVMDHEGIETLLREADRTFPRPRHPRLDAGYCGEDNVADRMEKTLRCNVKLAERPKKPTPEEVLIRSGPMKAWA